MKNSTLRVLSYGLCTLHTRVCELIVNSYEKPYHVRSSNLGSLQVVDHRLDHFSFNEIISFISCFYSHVGGDPEDRARP